MVLILSSNADASTTVVIRWLNYLGAQYIRINGDTDSIRELRLDNEDFIMMVL